MPKKQSPLPMPGTDCLTAQANEGMNTLTNEKRCAVIKCLVDGCSIRATTRITGVAKNTIQKLTRDLGQAVLEYHDNVIRNIKAQRVQCDETWCFCYAKDKNLPDSMRGEPGVGSMWTWTALGCRYQANDRLEARGARCVERPLFYPRRARAACQPHTTHDRRQPHVS